MKTGVLVVLSLIFLWGCENDTTNKVTNLDQTTDKTCLGCHSSEAQLKEALGVAKDDIGGDVSPLADWEKVIITGANGEAFLSSHHGPNYAGTDHHALQCQYCHGGAADYTFANLTEAHVGLIADPSAPGQSACKVCHTDSDDNWTSACDGCHADIAAANANSLHTNLWGFKRAIEQRCEGDFASQGAVVQAGFQTSCATCHTTCGQCHVSRPERAGGGFPKQAASLSHRFQRTPDMDQQCTVCHGLTVGADFRGENGGTADVHYLAQHDCGFCHTGQELHGDTQHSGAHYTQRYQVATMPRCEDCHTPLPANVFHGIHGSESRAALQCQVCHSQPYANCTDCHNLNSGDPVVTEGTQLKIARNVDPARSAYAFVLVRHVPVAAGTYTDWGLELPGYLSEPTWVYTSPHNIKRVTEQTNVSAGEDCNARCHDSPAGPGGFLLRESDLYEADGVTRLPDYDANIGIVIPDGFPSR